MTMVYYLESELLFTSFSKCSVYLSLFILLLVAYLSLGANSPHKNNSILWLFLCYHIYFNPILPDKENRRSILFVLLLF